MRYPVINIALAMFALNVPIVSVAAQAAPAAQDSTPRTTNLPEFSVLQRCQQQKQQDQQEIVVCGSRPERSPYRLPVDNSGFDPEGPVDSVSRERHRLYEVGDSGIHSCSTSGPGGYTGCTFKSWKDGREQRAGRKPKGRGIIGIGEDD